MRTVVSQLNFNIIENGVKFTDGVEFGLDGTKHQLDIQRPSESRNKGIDFSRQPQTSLKQANYTSYVKTRAERTSGVAAVSRCTGDGAGSEYDTGTAINFEQNSPGIVIKNAIQST